MAVATFSSSAVCGLIEREKARISVCVCENEKGDS